MQGDSPATNSRGAWWFMGVAALIMMITMGARQSLGLFVAPLDTATGLGVAGISFAMAVGQFVWGASQPVFGMVADRWEPGRVIVIGAVPMALGSALTLFADSQWALVLTLGVLFAAEAGAGSFSILIGAAARHLPPERRGFANGFINASGSFGQFVFAPLNRFVMLLPPVRLEPQRASPLPPGRARRRVQRGRACTSLAARRESILRGRTGSCGPRWWPGCRPSWGRWKLRPRISSSTTRASKVAVRSRPKGRSHATAPPVPAHRRLLRPALDRRRGR